MSNYCGTPASDTQKCDRYQYATTSTFDYGGTVSLLVYAYE